MKPISFDSKNTKVIAHRGLSGIEAENTIASFVAAGNRSYFGIETDVHVTKDGYFAVFHDDSTKRVCNEDLTVEDSLYSQLQKLSVFDKNGVTRSDRRIPQLFEYLHVCRVYEKTAVLELKNEMEKHDISRLLQIVKENGMLHSTIFISFNLDNLIVIREEFPNAKIQYLLSEYKTGTLEALKKYGFDIDINYKALNEEIINELKQNNIEINCWTCDNADYAEELSSLGVDYITTNILE